jgi:hypothetical protein
MPSLNHVTVSLRIFGDEVDPGEITKLLGREPEIGRTKGQVIVTSSGRERVERKGRWVVRNIRRDPGDLNAQIVEILESTTSDVDVWRSIAARHHVDIFCGLFLSADNEGVALAPETMKLVGERGIKVWLDVYAPERRPQLEKFNRWKWSVLRRISNLFTP